MIYNDGNLPGINNGRGTLILFSVSHHHAPVEIREKLAFDEEQRTALLQELNQRASEAAGITTCNRTEIYVVVDQPNNAILRWLADVIARHGDIKPDELTDVCRCQSGDEVVQHLLRVASGLDSVILGEPQILGQVRETMLEAHQQGTSGPILERLFQRALATGRRARSQTGISRGAGSISHAAVKLAQDKIGELSDKRALTIGLGEMGHLVARNLYANGVRSIDVCNRTLERAELTAAEIGGRAVPWDEMAASVRAADIVITATSSDDYILTRDHLTPTNGHGSDPLLIIDISVPRNVDPHVDTLPHVQLYDIDALQAVQTEGIQSRQREIPKVESIIHEEMDQFNEWFRGRTHAPIIQKLYSQAATIQHHEVERALRRLRHLSERDQEVVRALAYGITQKMLHTPVARLKRSPEADDHATALMELFGIE